YTGKTLKEMREEIQCIFGKRYFKEDNFSYRKEAKESLIQMMRQVNPSDLYANKLETYKDIDGFKWEWEDGTWCLLRFSGTEPLLRVIVESHDEQNIQMILDNVKQTLSLGN